MLVVASTVPPWAGGLDMRGVLQKALNAKTGKGFPSLIGHAREMLDAGQAGLPWSHPVLPDHDAMERWAAELIQRGWPLRLSARWRDGTTFRVDFETGEISGREAEPTMETLLGEESPL